MSIAKLRVSCLALLVLAPCIAQACDASPARLADLGTAYDGRLADQAVTRDASALDSAAANDGPTDAAVDPRCRAAPGGQIDGPSVLLFRAPDQTAEVRIERQYLGVGAGFSFRYRLVMMAVTAMGQSHCVLDANRLEYDNTHHNWRDRATARVGDHRFRLRWDWRFSVPPAPHFEPYWEYQLVALNATTDEVLWGPLPLDIIGWQNPTQP